MSYNPGYNTNMYSEGELPSPNNYDDDLAGFRPSEIIIQEMLQAALPGLAKIAADPTQRGLFQKMFGFYRGERFDAFRQWVAETTNIQVYDHFPQYDYKLPLVAVHAREESEITDHGQQVLGHMMVKVRSDVGRSSELIGQMMNATLDIICITPNPLTTMFLYRVIWYLIYANSFDLTKYADIHSITLSGGALQFDAQQFPNWQYSRVITMKFITAFDFFLDEMKAPKAVSFSSLIASPASTDEDLG